MGNNKNVASVFSNLKYVIRITKSKSNLFGLLFLKKMCFDVENNKINIFKCTECGFPTSIHKQFQFCYYDVKNQTLTARSL